MYGHDVRLLVDTGSSHSILHSQIWNEFPEEVRENLRPSSSELVTVDGSPLSVIGETTVTLNLGKMRIHQDFIIANVTQAGILGSNFFERYKATLDFARTKLIVEGHEVIMRKEFSQPLCCRISVAETTTVPARTEVILSGKVHARGIIPKYGVVEATSQYYNRSKPSIVIGRTLVNPQKLLVPVRVINPSTADLVLYRGTNIGLIQEASEALTSDDAGTALPGPLGAPLENLLTRSSDGLDIDQTEALRCLLSKHQDAFMGEDGRLGRTDRYFHHIETGDATPIKQHPRRLPIHQRAEVRQQIDQMLEEGIIRPSNSPWASPVVLVKKKDGTLRFCIDYRKLNQVTKKDAYPLPRIDDSLDTLSGSCWFSTLDLASGYWQTEVHPDDREKTAFTTGTGLFEFNVLPFGLCNAPSTFERLMEVVLQGLQWDICLIYLDDIIIFSKEYGEHLRRLSLVFEALQRAGLKLKPKKCLLTRHEVVYLGHIVSSQGIRTDPTKIQKVQEWPTPCNLTEVRSFLGLCSYYRKFIAGFAHIAEPLHRLTKKNVKFVWTEECCQAFVKLKKRLTTAPVLSYPNFDLPFQLDTDASDSGIGAVLSQTYDGKERVVAYASRALSKAEKRYSVTRRELLAVVTFIRHFKYYLYGRRFLLRTDHGSLRWLCNFKEPEGQVARWLDILNTYDFEVQHRPGTKHHNADALSRYPNATQVCNAIHIPGWAPEEIIQAQQDDPLLKPVIEWKLEGKRPEATAVVRLDRTTKGYWFQWDQLEVHDGILYRRWSDEIGTGSRLLLVVPHSLKERVMRTAHDGPAEGHLGIAKTIPKVKNRYFWIGCAKDIKLWIRQCPKCQKRKSPNPKHRAALVQTAAGAPMERIAIDIMGPLPQSARGNRYVLVICDYFTKWTESFAMPNQEAETVTRILVDEVICRFGVPLSIHSDQGKNFESNLFQQICQTLGVHKTRTSAYHPQSDGLVERFNRTLQAMLSKYVREDQTDWDVHLPYVMMAYRASENTSTKYTPNFLMFGREINLPLDILAGYEPNQTSATTDAFAWRVHKQLRDAYQTVRAETLTAQKRQKRLYDLRQAGKPLHEGDLVLLYTYRKKRGRSPKLQMFWKGPFRISQKLSDANYRIQNVRGGHSQIVHFDRLKAYEGQESGWVQTPKARTPVSVRHSPVVDEHSPAFTMDIGDTNLLPVETGAQSDSDSLPSPTEIPHASRFGRVHNPPAWMRAGDYELFGL